MPSWELIRARVFLFFVGMFRRMTLGVRAVMVNGDQVFLVRHTYLSGWHFPGGGIEPGEPAVLSLQREVREETGHKLTGAAQLHGIFLNMPASDRDHVLVYVCRDWAFVEVRKPDHEIAEAGWFDRHDLPERTTEGTRRRLAEIFDGQLPTEMW